MNRDKDERKKYVRVKMMQANKRQKTNKKTKNREVTKGNSRTLRRRLYALDDDHSESPMTMATNQITHSRFNTFYNGHQQHIIFGRDPNPLTYTST